MGRGAIKKNDRVEVLEGSHKGESGKVVSTNDRPLMQLKLDNGESGMIAESALRRIS